MNRILIVVAFLCMAAAVAAQAPPPKPRPGAGGPRSDLANEELIRKLYGEFTAAWNAHDPKKMASLWTIDGDTVEPDGMSAKGRDEVERHFTIEQLGAMKDSELKLTVDSVWFITADVALIEGTYLLLNATDPNSTKLPPRKGLVTSVLMKEHGRWRVAASRSMIPIPLPWRPK